MDPRLDYVDVGAINNFLAQQQRDHPDVSTLIMLSPPSMALLVSRNKALPFIYVTGLQHGNEWVSGSVVCTLIASLLSDQANLVKYQFLFAPVVNHYGYTRSLDPSEPDQYIGRKTEAGIDMNRNWPTVGWRNPGIPPDAINYPGTKPLETVEGLILANVFNIHSPVTWVFDMHSYATSVLFPYADKDEDQPLGESRAEELRLMLDTATKIINPDRKFGLVVWNSQSGWSLYGATSFGTLMDWSVEVQKAKSAFTFELPPSVGDSQGGFRPNREILPIVGTIVWQAFSEYLMVY